MANKKLRFVALIAVVLMLVCMLVACTTTATSSVSYKVTIHSDGQSDIVWDRQTDFPTLSKEHHTVAGLYLDAEYKTAVTPEDLVNMFLTGDIDVYVKYDRIHYSITVHPLNGGSDVIWQNAPGNKIPEFKKVGYVMSGFYFDENCTQPADSVFTEDILENKEVWVKWVECDHKALAPTDWTTDKKATCTEDGHKVATCPTCDKTLEDTIDALGHNQDGSITHKDADCTNSGVVGGTYCTRCNNGKDAAETTIPVDPTKHSFGEWVNEVPATCVSTGTKGHKDCSVCQKSFTANNVEITDLTINATGHSYGNVVYVWADDYSTCTAKHVCENGTCEHEETATATVSPQKTQEATCQQVELTTYTATFTASWAKTQVVEDVKTAGKADHNYSEDWTIDKVATCTEDGSKSHHCLTEGCDSKSDVTTIAASHTYGEWIAPVSAKCETDGTRGHYHCSVCKANFDAQYKKLESITISATGHEPTQPCQDEDNHWYACKNDGCTYTTQKVAHTWDKGEQTKDPTETEEGEKTYTCTVCRTTKTENTGKLDHVHTFDTTKWSTDDGHHWHPATCAHTDEKDGYAEHTYGDVTYTWTLDNTTCIAVHSCKCGYSENETATVTKDVTQAATCTLPEISTLTAKFVNKAFATQTKENVKTADALGHVDTDKDHKCDRDGCTERMGEHKAAENSHVCDYCQQKASEHTGGTATCTEKAECTVCGEKYGELGDHTYGVWVDEVPATCVSEGTKGHKDCTVCNKSFAANNDEITALTIAIDKDNHDIEPHTAKAPTCTEIGWDAYDTCKRAGCEYTTYNQLNATGHSYGNEVYVWADDYSTCTAKHVCENGTCEHEETATATVSPQKTQEATCQQVELTTYTATFTASWAKTQVVEDVKTAGKADHNYSEDWTIDKVATCTEDGSKSHHCLTEGCDSKSDVTTIAASHTYGEWIDEVPATCVSTGTKGHKDCSVCKKHFDNEGNEIAELTIDKSAHSTTHTDKVDATCSVAGNIEYWYCSVCETYYSDEACTKAITVNDTVIPAIGEHTYTFVAEVPSTQTEAGTKAHYHCDGCKKDFDLNKVEVTESDLVIEAGKKATYTSTIVIEDYATTNGWVAASGNSGTQYNHVENDIFTVNVSYKTSGATNTGKYYEVEEGNQWRIYESDDPSIVIAATKSEYKLTKLIVTFKDNNYGVLLNGTEQVASGNEVGITGDSITLGVGHSSGSNKGQARITKIQVEFSFQTDADIAAEDLAKAQEAADELESAIDDMKKEYGADGTYDVLPTTDKNGATVTWSVDENNFCSITEDGKLSIVKPTVEQGNQQITLTATIKVGDQTVTKTVIITITAGVAQHTLTISEDKDYIRIVVEDADGNIIDGDTTVDEGTTLTITVTNTDAENYAIVKVLAGTNELTKNEDGTYTFTIIEDTEISVETKLNLVCKVEGATLKTYAELITLTPSSGDSSEMYYTIGYVNSITNDTYGNMYIEDADGNKLLVYGTYNCDGTVKYADLDSKPAVGDVVVLYGVMTKYNTTYEMKDARILQINLTVYTPATSTITINATGASNATVAVGTTTVDSTSDFTATNGSEFTFTVTVEENYQATVTASVGTVTSGDNGVYTITVTANTTITIVTSEVEGGDEGGGTGTDTPSTGTVTTDTITISAMGWSNGTKYTSITKDGYTITASGSTYTGNYYDSGTNWRIYQNENPTLKFEAKAGYTIVSVKITYTNSNSGVLTKDESDIKSNTVVEVNASSVTFGVGNTGTATNGQVRITAIEVVYKEVQA